MNYRAGYVLFCRLLPLLVFCALAATAGPANGSDADDRQSPSASIERDIEAARYDSAEKKARQWLSNLDTGHGGESPELVEARRCLASVLWKRGRYRKGESEIRAGLETARRIFPESHEETAKCLNTLGLVLMAQGEYDEARLSYFAALEMFRELSDDDTADVASCLNNIGAFYGEIKDGVTSEAYYRASLEMNRRLYGENHSSVARGYHNLGFGLRGQGDLLRAQQLLEKAVRLRRDIHGENHPDVAMSLHILGQVYLLLGDVDTCEALYRRALGIRRRTLAADHPLIAWNLVDLSGIYLNRGEYAEAEKLARESLAIRKRSVSRGPDVVRGLRHLAGIRIRMGDYEGAMALCEEAAVLHVDIFGRGDFETLGVMAYACEALGFHEEAESLYTLAAREYEAVRLSASSVRTRARWRGGGPYSGLAAERLALGDSAGAWAAVERAVGRGLTDLLVTPGGEGTVCSLREIQAELPQQSAILGWFDRGTPGGGNASWAYVVRKTGPVRWIRLSCDGSDRSIVDFPERFRESLRFAAAWPMRVARTDDITAQSTTVWMERFAPAQEHLSGVSMLVVVPSRPMLGIPVEALVDTSGVFLGDRFEVTYASSATTHTWLRRRGADRSRVPGQRALLVGDPPLTAGSNQVASLGGAGVYEAAGAGSAPLSIYDAVVLRSALTGNPEALAALPPLQHAREEVDIVSALMPHATVLVGADATEISVDDLNRCGDLEKFDFMHFATHALIDDRFPDRSALVLSQTRAATVGRTDPADAHLTDGLLCAEEIAASWKLNARLVVLSGCRTALGRENPGEGYIGLAHAFFEAGARSLLVSLWDADDAATALLMQRFYESLVGEPSVSAAAALREAKRWLRNYTDSNGSRPFAHPAYWAAFVLIGGGG